MFLGFTCRYKFCAWDKLQFSSHTLSQLLLCSLFHLTMERAIVLPLHLPWALILCSGTSYLLCMFTCTSAFDGVLGLILAMQSLSELSSVSLGGTSERKTAAGRNGWRKDPRVGWGGGFDCVARHSEQDGPTRTKKLCNVWNKPKLTAHPKIKTFNTVKHQQRLFGVQRVLRSSGLLQRDTSTKWFIDKSDTSKQLYIQWTELKCSALRAKVQNLFHVQVWSIDEPNMFSCEECKQPNHILSLKLNLWWTTLRPELTRSEMIPSIHSFYLCFTGIVPNSHCCHLHMFIFNQHSISVDEVQAKVALVHDEERLLSDDEAVVSVLFI